MFEPYLKSFYIRSTDPTQIKILKVIKHFKMTHIMSVLYETSVYFNLFFCFCFSFIAAWSVNKPGKWNEHIHYFERVPGKKPFLVGQCRYGSNEAWLTYFYVFNMFLGLCRPISRAWIRTLWQPLSRPLAGVPLTSGRWETLASTVWSNSCQTEMVRVCEYYSE